MTSRTDEIQGLILDIDNLLSNGGNPLAKLLSGQGQDERTILQRIRSFLVDLHESESMEEVFTDEPQSTPLSSLLTRYVNREQQKSHLDLHEQKQESTNLVSEQLQGEMMGLFKSLQNELSTMLQQRAHLSQEIRELEQKRGEFSPSQQLTTQEQIKQIISQTVPALIDPLVKSLIPHLNTTGNKDVGLSSGGNNPVINNSSMEAVLGSTSGIEKLANLTKELDQRLLSLDGTVNVIFQALERNINSYYQSLSQALTRMHNQGIEGEQLMADFIKNLQNNLQNDSLTFLVQPTSSQANPNIEKVSSHGTEEMPDLGSPPINYESYNLEDEVDELYASLFTDYSNEPVKLWESLLPEDSGTKAEFASIIMPSESEPDSNDTITILTDLLVDVGNTPFSQDKDEEIIPNWENFDQDFSEREEKIEEDLEVDLFAGYIATSPQENPLDLGDRVSTQDEILNTSELAGAQELESDNCDITSFDWELDSRWEGIKQVENSLSLTNSSEDTLEEIVDQGMIFLESPTDITAIPTPEELVKPNILQAETNQVEVSQLTPQKDENSSWYLGIDLGTTGISAALLNHTKLIVHPIYWSAEDKSGKTTFTQSFRLPAEVYLPTGSIPHSHSETQENPQDINSTTEIDNGFSIPVDTKPELYSTHLKPFLHVGVSYKNNQNKWEPVLQLNEFAASPLIWVVRSLSKLLLTLKSDRTSTTPALSAHATGMEKEAFLEVINDLTGVICSCPGNWSEQYRFNVRESILTSKLVSHANQIFFVEEAIATLLPELDPSRSTPVQVWDNQGIHPLKITSGLSEGATLALNIGASATEMVLVDLVEDLSKLTYKNLTLHSFSYGGKAMEQDIICQLLLPPETHQTHSNIKESNGDDQNNSWHWQPTTPGLDRVEWSSLNLTGLELPQLGQTDTLARTLLQQRLESSVLGRGMLDAAMAIKLILQHQVSFTLKLADQYWKLYRQDLESQILVPYVRRLNGELNRLLVARGVPAESIAQVVISGGVSTIPTIKRWLGQKLPHSKIIQDLHPGVNGSTSRCSRVAYGLATALLYPQFLEISRQQYTDYFLFSELLNIVPNSLTTKTTLSLSLNQILELLESRGINTKVCQQRLLAFLEGELPGGLVPITRKNYSPRDGVPESFNYLWLTKNSQENPDYRAISSTPLFQKQGNLTYRFDIPQILLLRRYLNAVKDCSLQSFSEPYTFN
ncbi:hypothetical protein [Cylindrospermopsis curvispora]|uniref:Hsp70 family protein n=1 Tax=Cylindrospermopsis curvispora GIHE-G1 TaxID=2666332 RepID=A0A7H0F0B5_9CYAN|nr:hypothetical protein [Cylindrospermopsis curvispora]QNP29481.1 hypothetical protein IAR63_16965 [Cylindrospermopsis curvispora GIHE-G1]